MIPDRLNGSCAADIAVMEHMFSWGLQEVNPEMLLAEKRQYQAAFRVD